VRAWRSRRQAALSKRPSRESSQRKLFRLACSIDWKFVKRRPRYQPEQLFHFGPTPNQYRSHLIDWRFLIGRRKNETAQARLPQRCALRLVFKNSAVASDDNSRSIVTLG
jgi:hypothetical protein